MGLIFVPYIRETLCKSFQRVSSESTSGVRSSLHGSNSNERSYQSLEDLVRIYDNPYTPDGDMPDASGETQASDSNSPSTEEAARVPSRYSIFFPLRRPQTASPGSTTAVSSVDRRTVRLLEVLSAYYVRAAYDRARSNTSTPPLPTASSSPEATPSSSSPFSFRPTSLGLLQGSPSSSNIISRPAPAPAVPERSGTAGPSSSSRTDDDVRSRSSQTEEAESSSRRPQFILRPDPREMSAEELRFSQWHNGPLIFRTNSDDDPDSDTRRPRHINRGPGLLGPPPQRSSDDELVPFVRRTDHSSSASSSSPSSSSGGLFRYSSNIDLDSESAENTPQAYLWHNETRTNVSTHGCLRLIMRRHPAWEEQVAQNGFVEYWHYSTIPRRGGPGFEVVRDGVARLPWPLMAVAEVQTLRSFAYQINSVHHRGTPLTDYQGNLFDVVLVPSHTTLGEHN